MERKLHIGGRQQKEGWEIVNAVAASYVDHVGNANDLSQFDNNTFAEIYASHVVEHFDYKRELLHTLKEWRRVLRPGGKLYVSVPDMDILSQLILTKDTLTFEERFFVMRMLFGGHVDKYDYHVVGLNEEFLTQFLVDAGYVNIQKVEGFGIFDDTSNMMFKDVAISLNMIAEKPDTLSSSRKYESTPGETIGRNELCSCGSGKRYKKCHGKIT